MRKLLLLTLLVAPLLYAQVKAPIDIEKDKIKLERDKKKGGGKKDIIKKKKQTEKEHKKIVRRKLKDKPKGDASRLKLPDTIINIEDKSEMLLKRNQDWRSLIPDIDRKRKGLDNPLGGPISRKDLLQRKAGKQTISSFEFTYGSFDSLFTYVSTGKEDKNLFSQIAYMRKRNNGFSKNGVSIANSLAGLDNLHIDLGGNYDEFEFSLNGNFIEKQDGLQGNTNFFQSRKRSLGIVLKTSYIFSSTANMKFELRGETGHLSLDTITSPQGLDTLGMTTRLDFGFSWARRRFLAIGLKMQYEKYDATFDSSSETRDLSVYTRGGLSLGPFYLHLGAEMHLTDLREFQFLPAAKLTLKLIKNLDIYFEFKRDLLYPDFKSAILKMPYATYIPFKDPSLEESMNGGIRYRVLGNLLLLASIKLSTFDGYYTVAPQLNGLFALSRVNDSVTITSVNLGFKYTLSETVQINLRHIQKITKTSELPYEPDMLFRMGIKFSIRNWGTILKLSGEFAGQRKDAASADLDNYFLVVLRLQQTFVKNVEGVLQVVNLLNQDYYLRDGYKEPGITVHGGMSIKF